jgi:uncharacterized phage protein gp47/JayE
MYEDTTYDVILERMLSRVSDAIDKREGSVIYDTHSPTAMELQNIYIALDALIANGYGDTAAREFLVLLCKDRGITPKAASNAVLQGVFTPASIGADKLVGQRFNIDDLNYVVLSVINEDAGTYQVQCETAGETGNQHMGSMIPMDYIQGLETATLTGVLIPGEDEEDTEVLRKRYYDSFGEFAFGGNRADYLNKVRSISGVGGVKLDRVWNGGIKPSDLIPGDAVQEWYSGLTDLPEEVSDWLQSVYAAALEKKLVTGGTVLVTITNGSDYGEASSQPGGLVDTVQTALDPTDSAGEGYGLAPIGHVVTVRSASPVAVQISTDISFNTGYSWSTMKGAIEAAVSDYLLSLRKDWESNDYTVVRIAQLESTILALDGVVDIDNTKINGSGSNLILTKYQIPIFGGVSV